MEDIIRLNGMSFHAYHGVYEEEKKEGQLYEADVELHLDLEKVSRSDSLSEGIDYCDVYQAVAEEMAIPSNLIENVAYRICGRLKSDFPCVSQVTVRLRKNNPPVPMSVIKNAEIEMSR